MSWYKMHRGWMKHPAFKDNDTRIAWIWLIEHAAICPVQINIRGNAIIIGRGQLSFSIRYLAQAWGVSKPKTETMLKLLRKWDMIQTETRTGRLLITICEYSKYQDKPDTKPTANRQTIGQPTDSQPTPERTNTKNKRNKEKKEGGEASRPEVAQAYAPDRKTIMDFGGDFGKYKVYLQDIGQSATARK